MHNVEHIF